MRRLRKAETMGATDRIALCGDLRPQLNVTIPRLQIRPSHFQSLQHQAANVGIVEDRGALVHTDRTNLTAVAFETAFGIVDGRTLDEEEPHPPRVEHQREDRRTAVS